MSHQPKSPATSSRLRSSIRTSDASQDISEILSKRYGRINFYMVMMLLLAIAIIWTAIRTAEQIQQYHQDYILLQDMKRQYRKLQVEHQRLLIEQQTFSATPQIANRAVTELGMFSPNVDDKLILQPSAPANTQLTAPTTTDSIQLDQFSPAFVPNKVTGGE